MTPADPHPAGKRRSWGLIFLAYLALVLVAIRWIAVLVTTTLMAREGDPSVRSGYGAMWMLMVGPYTAQMVMLGTVLGLAVIIPLFLRGARKTAVVAIVAAVGGLAAAIPFTARVRQPDAAARNREAQSDLKVLGLAYRSFCDVRKRGPHDADELQAYDDPRPNPKAPTRVRRALEGGDYVVTWDVDISRSKPDDLTVLAYHKDVPEKGGAVLLQNGAARIYTREEFEQAPKAVPAGK